MKKFNALERMLQTEMTKDPILAVRNKSMPLSCAPERAQNELTTDALRSAESEMEVRHMVDLRNKLATALDTIEVSHIHCLLPTLNSCMPTVQNQIKEKRMLGGKTYRSRATDRSGARCEPKPNPNPAEEVFSDTLRSVLSCWTRRRMPALIAGFTTIGGPIFPPR